MMGKCKGNVWSEGDDDAREVSGVILTNSTTKSHMMTAYGEKATEGPPSNLSLLTLEAILHVINPGDYLAIAPS